MIIRTLKVYGSDLCIIGDCPVVEHNVNTYEIDVEYIGNKIDWSQYQQYMVFIRKNKPTYQQRIINNKCTIPPEVLTEPMLVEVGIYGESSEELINTEIKHLHLVEGAYQDDAIFPGEGEYDPSIWTQIFEELNKKQDLLISSGAVVGQGIRISAIDENGKPTAWETTDLNKELIFDSLEEAEEYAQNAEIGQILTVIDTIKDQVTVYVIANSRKELSPIGGSISVGDYNNLQNKPKINDITLIGNKTSAQLGLDIDHLTNFDIEEILSR